MSMPFMEEGKSQFDAVAQQFGLSCVSANERSLRYESDAVFLSVNFDNGRSYELGVEIGQKNAGQPERPFSLAEILRLSELADTASIDGMMVHAANQLHDGLARLATLTTQYAADFLKGDTRSFMRLAQLREQESMAFALQRDLRTAISRAESAWAVKDYKALVAALEPMEPYLSVAERKRLNYSRKQLDPSH